MSTVRLSGNPALPVDEFQRMEMIQVSLDKELLRQIDRVAFQTKKDRSADEEREPAAYAKQRRETPAKLCCEKRIAV